LKKESNPIRKVVTPSLSEKRVMILPLSRTKDMTLKKLNWESLFLALFISPGVRF